MLPAYVYSITLKNVAFGRFIVAYTDTALPANAFCMCCVGLYRCSLPTTIITGGRPSTSVNGDIAIQWESSNYDPSQNQNPLTDYDKTLHNWLRPRGEHLTQNLCQSTQGSVWANTWNIRPYFFILIYFFPGLVYWSDPWTDFHEEWLKLRAITHRSAFLGSARWPKTFRGSNSQKPSKLGVNMLCRASQLRVNEDWRHRRIT